MREFVLSKLIEEAQTTKANMDEYMRTVNPELDKYPDIKAFIEEKFKSDIRSTELGKFYEERYKWKVKQLFEYKKVYEDYAKIYQTATDETKAETKEKMDLAKSRYENALN
jgi:hypothetical protein